MTKAELAEVIGVGFATLENYADGASSLTWRYYDGVYKLLHVTFDPGGRVARYETQWDPNVYSKRP
jgi:transcriptional regulator with XRE-family HTH domain